MQKNETLNLRFDMKKVIRVIGMIFTIVKISAGTLPADNDVYLSDNILSSVKDISINKLLGFRKISTAIKDDFEKARFHYIIAYEIDNRLNDLMKNLMLMKRNTDK